MQKTEMIPKYKIDVKPLLNVISYINNFNTEICLNFDSDGLSITEMDCTNVCLNQIKLSNINFIEYLGTAKILINAGILYKALKEHKKEYVNIKIDNIKLYLSFSNGFNTEMPLIDIDGYKDQKVPELSFNNSFNIEPKRFKDIVKSFYSNGAKGSLKLSSDDNNNNLKIYMDCNDLNKSKIVLSDIFLQNDLKVGYSLEYLYNFVKVLFDSDLKINTNNDYPLQAEYNTDKYQIKFILAPRIENA